MAVRTRPAGRRSRAWPARSRPTGSWNSAIAFSSAQEEGRRQAGRDLVLHQATRRFGPDPGAAATIASLDEPNQLDALAERVLTAAASSGIARGGISQSRGAKVAGLSRGEFLDALFRAKVPACQETVEDLPSSPMS